MFQNMTGSHAYADNVLWENNFVYGSAPSTASNIGVLAVRNGSASFRNNHIYYTGHNGDYLIHVYEGALNNLIFEGNTVETSNTISLLSTDGVGGVAAFTPAIVKLSNNIIPNTVTHKGCYIRKNGLYASAAPTAATYSWEVGEVVYNTAPGVYGWVCTEAGSPGTWTSLAGTGGGVGGEVGGTENAIPYASDSDTLSDSVYTYNPSGYLITPPAVANPYWWLRSLSHTSIMGGANEGSPDYYELRNSATPGTNVFARWQISGTLFGSMTLYGKLGHVASTTARPSGNIPSGTAPSSPSDGDYWYDGTHLYFRNSSTNKDLLSGGFDPASPGTIGGTTPAAGNFTTLAASGILTGAAGIVSTSADYTVGTGTPKEAYGYIIMMTGAYTVTLPAVVQGMSVVIYSTDANIKTITPYANDRIVRSGSALSDGASIHLPASAGNFVVLFGDSAAGWTTLGGIGTLY